MIRTKEELQKSESEKLAPYASHSKNSKGRRYAEKDDRDLYGRLCFQKDRDRIIHCKSFRRLDEKTQVFPAFFGDHYRTRLTHSLEVAQISRDICRRLGLNEDLAEAIALAHDLGHPPFGHAGEDALNEIMQEFGLHFEHNEQSRRVVEKLEKLYPDFDGLNLSIEVLEWLQKHKTAWDQPLTRSGNGDVFGRSGDRLGRRADEQLEMHLEGQVVNLADEITYTNHDMDDGLRSGILKLEDLAGTKLWTEAVSCVAKKYEGALSGEILISRVISHIIYMMITDICENFDEKKIAFSPGMVEKIKELREVLSQKFYLSDFVKSKLQDGKKMIKNLFKFYLKNPDNIHEKYKKGEKLEVAVKDYIAGMTDQFLTNEIQKIESMQEDQLVLKRKLIC